MTREIPISRIDYGVNVRREKDEDIQELADSIEKYDVLQPLVVRPTGNGRYEALCGHRRLKALKKVGGDITVPCIIREDIEDQDELRGRHLLPLDVLLQLDAELVAAFDGIKRQYGGNLTNKALAEMLHKKEAWVVTQYFAMNTARKMYGEGTDKRVLDKNLTAGRILGRYRSIKRKATQKKKRGYTVEHSGRIITIHCESMTVLFDLLKKLEG